ncbi:MAG: hypothetical protein ABIR32_19485 [Ilumatobacteraceae bacterium]
MTDPRSPGNGTPGSGTPGSELDQDAVRSTAVFVVGGCAIAMIVAIAKPQVAHLVAQAVFVAVLGLVGVAVAVVTLHRLPTGPFATGWRPVRRVRPKLPRDISTLVDDLGQSRRRLPPAVVAKLVNLMTQRLALRHGLSPERDGDLAQIEQVLSPLAYDLVTARRSVHSGRAHPYERVQIGAFDPLMSELENL